MKIANQWVDGEDSVREDRQHPIKEEGGPSNWRNDRRKKKPWYDGRETIELVAAGLNNPRKEGSRDGVRQYSQGQYG